MYLMLVQYGHLMGITRVPERHITIWCLYYRMYSMKCADSGPLAGPPRAGFSSPKPVAQDFTENTAAAARPFVCMGIWGGVRLTAAEARPGRQLSP